MNENNYRNQVNVIYGAPCEVVAAGEERNLVQASNNNKRKSMEESITELEKILNFTRFPGEKEQKEKPGLNLK